MLSAADFGRPPGMLRSDVYRDAELFNLGLDFPQRFQEAVRAVTAAQVQAAATKYIRSDRLIQIVVTPPQP